MHRFRLTPLHRLSLRKSFIKKLRNIIRIGLDRQPHQTLLGSTKPNIMKLLSSLKPLFTAAIVIVLTPMGQALIPCVVKNYPFSISGKYFHFFTPQLSLLIKEKCGISSNQIYEAAATYLRSKIGDSSNLNHLRVSKTSKQQGLTADIVISQSVMDSFQDIN